MSNISASKIGNRAGRTLNPQRLAQFSAIVQAGSISKAAQALGCGKSVLSRQLAKLEAELGARLIQRSTRRLTLTEIGELVFAEAQHIDMAMANIEQLTAGKRSQQQSAATLAPQGLATPLNQCSSGSVSGRYQAGLR